MFDSKEPPNFRKGDIVLVSFPSQIDGEIGIKRRPAVIVSGNRMNIASQDVYWSLSPATKQGTTVRQQRLKL